MPSPFDALDAAISGAVLSAFGESVAASLRPRTRSDFAEGADSSRPVRPIRGVFSSAPAEVKPQGNASGGEFAGATRLSVALAEFWIAAADAACIPYAIRQGDHLALPARPGSPVYSVADIQRPETGDINLIIVRDA